MSRLAPRKDKEESGNVELQGYARNDPDVKMVANGSRSPKDNNSSPDPPTPRTPTGPNGFRNQHLNQGYVSDSDIDVTSGNKGTPSPSQKRIKKLNRLSSGGDSAVNLNDDDDDDYTDDTGVSLIYSHHEQVAFKNFSLEVRANVDVQRFLDNTYLTLRLHESDPDTIVDGLLHKMLEDQEGMEAVIRQAKNSLFTRDKTPLFQRTMQAQVHQLSRTIQGTGLFGADTVDYDMNWICAMCTVPAINEARVGIAILSSPANLGRNCQECRFVVLILTPTKVKGTKNEYERARTFGTMFANLDFRSNLLDAHSEEDFKDIVARHARNLAQRHTNSKIKMENADPIKLRCGFMGGLVGDLRRRLPHYISDYTDGLCDKKSISKTISCTFFLYFACILPCIAFGVLNDSNTRGVLTVEKVLYSQTFGGLVFAIFGGTPQIVLLTTAPLAIYSKIIFNISNDFGINFPAMYACVGLWNAFFLVLYSFFDLSMLMQYSTRSSEEIFALFISIAFAVDAFKNTAHNFDVYYNSKECESDYNTTAARQAQVAALNASLNGSLSNLSNVTLPEVATCEREISILYLLLLLGTAWLGVMLYNFTRTPYLTAGKREIMADYSLPISVIIMAFVGAYLFREVNLGESFDPDARKGELFQLVDFSSLTIGAIFGAMGLGFCLSLLFFMDQNISAALVNAPQNKMKKGTSYHWDLLVIAVINAAISIFAFPMVHAALPHSPLHVRALADVEERVVQGHITQTVVKVRETRVTSILSHVLIGVSIFLMFVLAYIPTPVLYGLFLYVAITALYDNQMFERILLFFTEQSAYPPNHYIRHVPQRSIHIFTLLQLVQLGFLCIFGFVSFAYLKMFFPVLIFLLIPIRHKVIPHIVDRKYIAAIDHCH